MMNINRNNYESFLVDYHEGTLSKNEVDELLIFLELNPDLKEESEEYENLCIIDIPAITYPYKSLLKKTEITPVNGINEENYTSLFIAAHENDLDNTQLYNLKVFLANNQHLQKEFSIGNKLRLKPDENVVFKGKETLKKHRVIPFKRYGIISVAVAAATLAMVALFRPSSDEIQARRPLFVASVEKMTVPGLEFPENTIIITRPVNDHRYPVIANLPITRDERNDMVIPVTTINKVFAEKVYKPPLEDQSNFLLPRFENFNVNIYERYRNYDLYAGNEDKTFIGKLLANSFYTVKSLFENNIPEIQVVPDGNNAIWAVAKAGIDGFNFFTDNNLQLVATVDEHGDITGYALFGDNIEFVKQRK